MAQPTNRATLTTYALRQLGEPVIEVNIDTDQIEDCLDDAITYWQEFHGDATYRTYVTYQLVQADLDNGYISIDPSILFIKSMFQIPLAGFGFNDFKYEFFLSQGGLASSSGMTDLAYYYQLKQYVSMIDDELQGTPTTTYVRHQDRLYIHGEFESEDLILGSWVAYEAFKTIDPATNTQMYSDIWLKEYTSALFKRQWGMNLLKFENMQLPGGVVVNGRQLYDDATADIDRLRDKIRMDHEEPIDFFVG